MRWITFFPKLSYEHLTKDVGLLPLYMADRGLESSLVYTGSKISEEDVSDEVGDLNLHYLEDEGEKLFLDRAFLSFLQKESKSIDVLNLYHYDRDTIYYGVLYKKLNPGGFLYIKLDAYNQHLKQRKSFSKNPFKNWLFAYKVKAFHQDVDLLSIENKAGLEIAVSTYPEWKGKIFYLPNGSNDKYLENIPRLPKEKTILSVGRLGSSDKNYELLLKALEYLNLLDWKLKIVGPITDEFQRKIDKYRSDDPEIFEKVELLGPIYDRAKLYEEFAKSRVFVLPSRFESFGIAYVEALHFGNVLVGNNQMSAYPDLCDQGSYGEYFLDNDPESLAKAIEMAKDKSRDEKLSEKIAHFASENFYWSKITRSLSSRIRNES